MNKLKTLPVALTMLGMGAVSSFAEIKLTDNLSLSGFLDMSATFDDVSEELKGNFDRFDLEFLLGYGDISARADITSDGMSVSFLQGFVNYSADGFGVTVGRILSSSGFEAAKPTGLYQYSYSKTNVYGGYQNGLALSYGTDMFALYGSVVTDVWDVTNTNLKTPGFEGQVSLMPMEGVTAKVAYLHQIIDTAGHDQQQLLNAWASYETGPLTVAGEYNMLMNWGADDNTGHGWLGMVNYAITDKIGATVRYSGIVFDGGDPDTEITFSPSYLISDNWAVLAEAKREIDAEVTRYAVESLFSF